MKKTLLIFLMMVFLLSGCNSEDTESKNIKSNNFNNMSGKASGGVWLSFSELAGMLSSENGFEQELSGMVKNCSELGIENIYIHVRSHCDSIYKSEYFPLTEAATKYNYDIFEYMINTFHMAGFKVHAWINPYRVSTATDDVNTIREDSPIHKWLQDTDTENDKNVCVYNGVYLNPAESEARKLVIDGIKEIITKYQVDGIHFDDYFYPTTDKLFDQISYNEYTASAEKPLELDDWRRANVNALISGVNTAVKSSNSSIIFSISPAASVDNNYHNLYADVKFWIKNNLVDCIIPQLYFGFEYNDSKYRFNKLLEDWKKLMSENGECKLIIGLAPYKIGTETAADGNEWQTENDLIARQVKLCYEDERVSGYVLFSYSAMVSENSENVQQRENLMKFKEVI